MWSIKLKGGKLEKMKIGIIGSGHIGSTVGALWIKAGHEILFSSRHPEHLTALVAQLGPKAHAGSIAEAVAFSDVLLLSVPWGGVAEAIGAAGSLAGKIVIDTTNQYGRGGLEHFPNGISALEFNAHRMPGAKLVKSYNTLTSGFQASAAGRTGPTRVAMPYAGENADAKQVVAGLITDSGFDPFDVGGWKEAHFLEAPRRPGAFYGEEWHLDTAAELLAQLTKRG
jgi:predicted dinucleotide-binding enzyme